MAKTDPCSAAATNGHYRAGSSHRSSFVDRRFRNGQLVHCSAHRSLVALVDCSAQPGVQYSCLGSPADCRYSVAFQGDCGRRRY